MVEIRFITDDEVAEHRRVASLAFGFEARDDADDLARFVAARPLETHLAAFDEGQMVATFASIDFDLTVPGATVAMAGTTAVTVQPTHRRQGLLTQMMRTHLEQAIERGQPLAGLWASEERIYGRYGYGIACVANDLAMPTRLVTLPPGPADVSVRSLTIEQARQELPAIYDRVRPQIPGWLSRSLPWWELRHLSDRPEQRDGAGALRFAVAERTDGAAGYVTYRLRRAWSGGTPDGTVDVIELVAADDGARRALWHLAANVDLFPNVNWWNAPIDDPVMLEADRFRSIRSRPSDSLWLRLLDVHEALEARRYERDGAVVLGVRDSYLDRGGTFALEVADGVGSCKPSPSRAEVELDISDLGALYLGGGSAHSLARASRVTGDPAAIRIVDDLFRTARQPHCPEIF